MLSISWHMLCCTENSCIRYHILQKLSNMVENCMKRENSPQFMVWCLRNLSFWGFFWAIFHAVIFKKSDFSDAFSELFLWNFTLPGLSISYQLSVCMSFLLLGFFTFLPADGLERKSPHCYKYTDTNQLINPGPNMPQNQVNNQGIYNILFPGHLLLATMWDKILYQPNFCFDCTYIRNIWNSVLIRSSPT